VKRCRSGAEFSENACKPASSGVDHVIAIFGLFPQSSAGFSSTEALKELFVYVPEPAACRPLISRDTRAPGKHSEHHDRSPIVVEAKADSPVANPQAQVLTSLQPHQLTFRRGVG
jgi:hypothetical protein